MGIFVIILGYILLCLLIIYPFSHLNSNNYDTFYWTLLSSCDPKVLFDLSVQSKDYQLGTYIDYGYEYISYYQVEVLCEYLGF